MSGSFHVPAALPPENGLRYPKNRRLGELQRRSERFERKKERKKKKRKSPCRDSNPGRPARTRKTLTVPSAECVGSRKKHEAWTEMLTTSGCEEHAWVTPA